MIDIKKILIPTDFSQGAEQAYPVGKKIASAFEAKVDFLHVIPTVKYLHESMKKLETPLDPEKEIYPEIIRESEQMLDKAMKNYIPEENKGSFYVKIDRKVSDTIIEHATSENYDMIIMGAKGKHESTMFRGSTTEKIIRNSQVPVFSIDSSMDEYNINNILVPTDSSALSFASFPLAVVLADTFQANITLYHVMELYGSPVENYPRSKTKGEFESAYNILIDQLNNFLTDAEIKRIRIQRTDQAFMDRVVFIAGDDSRTISLFTKIEKGLSAHYEIEKYARENADLVVLATHGHTGLAHLVLGSTAEKVAQYVDKPVLTVRPGKNFLR